MEGIGTLPRYNTMKCQLQSMSVTLLGIHDVSYGPKQIVTIKCQLLSTNVRYYQMSVTINKCQASFLEMLGNIIQQVHMKLSGIVQHVHDSWLE